jgi:hypothetical protein
MDGGRVKGIHGEHAYRTVFGSELPSCLPLISLAFAAPAFTLSLVLGPLYGLEDGRIQFPEEDLS